MSSWRIGLGRSSTIVLAAATILCLHPRRIAAQDLQAKPASTDRPDAAPCSLLDEKSQPSSQDVTGECLPDTPLPAGQAQEQAQDSGAPSVQPAVQQPNQLPPTLTRTPLTGQDKF